MNNGNNPAHPLTGDAYTNFASYDDKNQFTSYDPQCQGLTKREAFAMAAMQGILSNETIMDYIENDNDLTVVNQSVDIANKLLKELEK